MYNNIEMIKNDPNLTKEQKVEKMEEFLKKKKKSKRLKIIFLVIGAIFLFVLSIVFGIFANKGNVSMLTNEVAGLKMQLETSNAEIVRLKGLVNDTSVKEVQQTNSLYKVEGTGSPALKLIDEYFIAPTSLELPNSKDDVNNSSIYVGSVFKFKPSENWNIRMQGTTLELIHPTKIWGSIKAVTINEFLPITEMQPLLQKYFIGYPSTTINYRKVYLSDYQVGLMATAPIKVDVKEGETQKDMTLNVGFVQSGDYAILFMFLNENNELGVSQELIDLLLRSGSVGDNSIKLE